METREIDRARQGLIRMASILAQVNAYVSWSDEFSRKECREAQNASWRTINFERLVSTSTEKELYEIGFIRLEDRLLIPLWLFPAIQSGYELQDINGRRVVVGKDRIDTDTRGGCIAYGIFWKMGAKINA